MEANIDGGQGKTNVIIIVTTMMATFTVTLCDYLIHLLTAQLASQQYPLSLCEIYRAYIELCSINSMHSPQDMCDLIA